MKLRQLVPLLFLYAATLSACAPQNGGDPPRPGTEHPTFATRTMADLLESQGAADQADAVRASLPSSSSASQDGAVSQEWPLELAESLEFEKDAPNDEADRIRVVTTLESWLYICRGRCGHDGYNLFVDSVSLQ